MTAVFGIAIPGLTALAGGGLAWTVRTRMRRPAQ